MTLTGTNSRILRGGLADRRPGAGHHGDIVDAVSLGGDLDHLWGWAREAGLIRVASYGHTHETLATFVILDRVVVWRVILIGIDVGLAGADALQRITEGVSIPGRVGVLIWVVSHTWLYSRASRGGFMPEKLVHLRENDGPSLLLRIGRDRHDRPVAAPRYDQTNGGPHGFV